MSQENVEIVRRFIEAWSDHDREEMARYLHPDAVFHSAITNIVGETFQGRDRSWGYSTGGRTNGRRSAGRSDEYVDVDEFRVVTLHRVIATGRASGIETVRELGGLIEIRDGLVVSQWIYLDRKDALEASGLAESR